MREVGVLVGFDGQPLYWHEPEDRTVASLPDSRDLWAIFWEHRAKIFGYAHSHPGSGAPAPSYEDVTTFSAIEVALGRRLMWWITTATEVKHFIWQGPGPYAYRGYAESLVPHNFPWLEELRSRSNY